MGFGVSKPRPGVVTHMSSVKPWANCFTPLRLGFLISKIKGTILMPALEVVGKIELNSMCKMYGVAARVWGYAQ